MMRRRFMEKLVVLALALMVLTGSAFAATQDEALATAQALVGEGAQLVESEQDDGMFEFDFRQGDVKYDVDVRASDGAVIEFETTYTKVPGAAGAALTEAEAKAKAMAQYPDAQVALAIPEREDGNWFYEVFLTTGGEPVTLTINAETGEVKRIERYPAAAGVLTADNIAGILGEPVTDLELSYDNGKYIYEGDTAAYEFEIDAVSGAVLEKEQDD